MHCAKTVNTKERAAGNIGRLPPREGERQAASRRKRRKPRTERSPRGAGRRARTSQTKTLSQREHPLRRTVKKDISRETSEFIGHRGDTTAGPAAGPRAGRPEGLRSRARTDVCAPRRDDSARGTGDDILCDSEQAQPRTLTDGDHGAGGRWPRLPLGATARTTPPSCQPCGPRDAAKPTGTENRRHVNTREQRGGCGPRAATCGGDRDRQAAGPVTARNYARQARQH